MVATVKQFNLVYDRALDPAASRESTAPTGSLESRNITIDGHRTSVRLEPAMWAAMEEICRRTGRDRHQFCSLVARRRNESSLTAGIRVAILDYFRSALHQLETDRRRG